MAQVSTVTVATADRLDAIVHLAYGRTFGYVEAVWVANPGLAELGVIVPAGTVITLPDVTPEDQAAGVVRLWT